MRRTFYAIAFLAGVGLASGCANRALEGGQADADTADMAGVTGPDLARQTDLSPAAEDADTCTTPCPTVDGGEPLCANGFTCQVVCTTGEVQCVRPCGWSICLGDHPRQCGTSSGTVCMTNTCTGMSACLDADGGA